MATKTIVFLGCALGLSGCTWGPVPIAVGGYGIEASVTIPARPVPTKVVIPAQTIVVPASSQPVIVPLTKAAVVVASPTP